MRRRTFIRRTGTVAASASVLGATAPAAASDVVPTISTREHFEDDGSLAAGHTATGYDTDGDVPGVDTACAGDVTVFIHGWDKNSDDPEAAAHEKIAHAANELFGAGYWGTVVGYTWDNDAGGGADFGWGEAQTVAQNNGPKLAQFALDYKVICGGTLRLVSHSLGAQVLFSALRTLDASAAWNDFGFRVDSVHLLGAAQDNEAPTTEWRATYDAVRTETVETVNYHSEADDVLQWIYNSFEFDQALGETGAEAGNTTSANYADFDATDQVGDDHSGYLTALSDEIVAHM